MRAARVVERCARLVVGVAVVDGHVVGNVLVVRGAVAVARGHAAVEEGAPPPNVPRSATHCANVASWSPWDVHVFPVLRKAPFKIDGVHAMARARMTGCSLLLEARPHYYPRKSHLR